MRPSALVIAAALLLAGCGGTTGTPAVREAVVSTAPRTVPADTVRGIFLPFSPGATAITYDPPVVPAGSAAELTLDRRPDGLAVRLAVTGMVPRRAYGAHLHTSLCTAVPAQSGPHYQHVQGPPGDPRYANVQNEVWLDFTADGRGAAVVAVKKLWTLDPERPPRSLVLHAAPTPARGGMAGTPAPRAACLSLPG
jgi:Cu-Zn family superoxide dismutase